GTEALYQLDASKPAEETASAVALTFADDCTAQPSRSAMSPSARADGERSAAASNATQATLTGNARRSFLRRTEIMASSRNITNPRRQLNRFNRPNSPGRNAGVE